MQNSVDYSRKWYVLSAVAISILLGTINAGIVNVALPTLENDFGSTFSTVQWVILVYMLVQATLMPIIGRLGDMIGRKPIFVNGFIVFAVGSLLCGLAPDIYWLIAFRIVQAVGGAMMLTLAFALIVEAFPAHERGRAVGFPSTFSSTGIVLGPIIGGFMLSSLNWRWLFFVTVPLSLLGIVMAIRFVPDYIPEKGQRFDYAGAMLLFVSLLSLLLALTWGQRLGYDNSTILLLFGAAIGTFATFIWVELRARQPMIELRLFRDQLFAVNLATRLFTFMALAGTILLLPFYMENVLGYQTRQIGLVLAVIPLCLGIFSPLSGALADRIGARIVMSVGILFLAIGYFSLSTLDEQTTALGIVLRLIPVGLGMGTFQAPNNSAIMGAVLPNQLGIASGLVSISRTLGQTLGVAILGAIWAAQTMAHFGIMLPGGVTSAPPAMQVAGLHDVMLVVFFLALIALFFNIRLLRRKSEDPALVAAAD